MAAPSPFSRGPGVISLALHTLVSQIPPSLESPHSNPNEHIQGLAKVAALKAGALSGSFTLPPGPLGMATVLPDLLSVWRIQQQLVADIAAAYGKTSVLTPETMVVCLFKHGGVAFTGRLVSRRNDEVVVQRIARRTLVQLLEKIAVRLTQRIAAKSVSRWLPVLGAVGAGAYAYYDTTHVAANAIELFSQDLRLDEPEAEPSRSRRVRPRSKTKSRQRGGKVRASKSTRRPRGR